MNFNKIKLNAILIVCSIIILVFLFLGFYNYSISKKQIHNEIINSSIPLLRDSIYTEIEKSFIPALRVASVMSKDSFLINWVIDEQLEDSNKIIQYLKKVKEDFNYRTTFFISSQSLKYYYFDGILKTISPDNSHDIWYYNFLESGLDYALDVDIDEALNNKLTIFINYKVNDFKGNFIGVTGIGIEMDNFSSFLNDQQNKYNRKIFLTDKDGTIQAHSDMSVIENYNIYEMDYINQIANELLTLQNIPTMLSYNLNGESILISSKFIEAINWFLIVEQNETEALEPITGNLKRTFLVGIILLLIMLPLIILTINSFSKKLELIAVTDPLTEAYNRREFNTQLSRALANKLRNNSSLTIISIDIDNFKTINDTMGHPFGDKILKLMTREIYKLKRTNDILCRLGGDEFIILMDSNEEQGIALANRIKEFFKCYSFGEKKDCIQFITLSMGVYEATSNDNEESIIKNCDNALYSAKKSGRNTIKTLDK